jgi:aldehyde:ferredoxin oxidoreductase
MASGPLTAKLLHIDLTARRTRVEEIPENILRRHLGGGAMAAWLLLRELKPGVDPLGPDNVLVFTTSVGNGALKGSFVERDKFVAARRTYYEMAGWDPETGKPTAAKLAELGLTDVKA